MPVAARRDWGTTAVLLIDLVAALGVSTWGVLYLKTELKYFAVIFAVTFA